jgi:hypothetical protein
VGHGGEGDDGAVVAGGRLEAGGDATDLAEGMVRRQLEAEWRAWCAAVARKYRPEGDAMADRWSLSNLLPRRWFVPDQDSSRGQAGHRNPGA